MRRRWRAVRLIAPGCALLCSGVSYAQAAGSPPAAEAIPAPAPPPAASLQPVYHPFEPALQPPGYHTHDGLFLRGTSGVGYLRATYSDRGYGTTISGGGVAMSFALGGALLPNLIVYGETWVFQQQFNPTSQTGTGPTAPVDGSTLQGIGPGIAYYLEPANLYFSSTVALSHITLNEPLQSESPNTRDNADTGLGFAATVGKEWWASGNWGFGVAGVFHGATMKMTLPDTRILVTAFSILFSATYN